MRSLVCILPLLTCAQLWAQPQTLIEWNFDTPGDTEGWVAANHISDLQADLAQALEKV